jgi:plastocyanin
MSLSQAATEDASSTKPRPFRALLATTIAALVGVVAAGSAVAATPVTVRITDSGAVLSRTSVSVGTVVFVVSNRGRLAHTFGIGGSHTRRLGPGATASLTVTFRAPGRYAYIASKGGVLRVITAPAAWKPVIPAGAHAQQSCGTPTTTTVRVTMTDTTGSAGYTFAPAAVSCGSVTFVLANGGQSPHGLELMDPAGNVFATSTPVPPSSTASLTADFKYRGTYEWSDLDGLAGEAFETTAGWLVSQ